MAQNLIDTIGGEEALLDLVEHFYDIIETSDEGAAIVKLHKRGHGMTHARTEQFNFLSGFMGGRRYYEEKYGHMDVKRIHEHVPISTQDAKNWLTCMDRAINDKGLHGADIDRLRSVFRRIALMLVNDLDGWGLVRTPPQSKIPK